MKRRKSTTPKIETTLSNVSDCNRVLPEADAKLFESDTF